MSLAITPPLPKTRSPKFLFFFSSRRRHTRYWLDWSSDVCSSDLRAGAALAALAACGRGAVRPRGRLEVERRRTAGRLGLLVVAWDAGARRALGVRLAWWRAALVDGVPALLYLVGVGFLVYVTTWAGWLAHAHVYEVALSDTQYGPFWGPYTQQEAHGFSAVTQGLRSLWHYHYDLWQFHRDGLQDAEHTYQSD